MTEQELSLEQACAHAAQCPAAADLHHKCVEIAEGVELAQVEGRSPLRTQKQHQIINY
jgi:hypothetical protein